MPFSGLDTAAVSRLLAAVVERDGDVVDAYFEQLLTVELSPEGVAPGVASRREAGLAVRLLRGERSWLASRDAIDTRALGDAVRQVVRVRPQAGSLVPETAVPPSSEPVDAVALHQFGRRLTRAIRQRRVAFDLGLTVAAHRREIQVVTPRLVPAVESESYYSLRVDMPWGRCGALVPTLDDAAAEGLAERLVDRFRSRDSTPPESRSKQLVLGTAATAVFLHEAVAHALEADTLALAGTPAAAIGVKLAPSRVSVLDDPGAAPEGLRRQTDDEGHPVVRRWLLRDGEVAQVLADQRWAAASGSLEPGACRRPSRHDVPGPRSTFLELLAGDDDDVIKTCGSGVYLPEADRGRLDPLTGQFTLSFPYARGIRNGSLGDYLGPCRLEGRVAELLERVEVVGAEAELAGAGWCAKSGNKLPVWASCPPILLDGVGVAS